ncbi:uncharacterized protein K452DRAFT_285991 [Aplosporella prunicola CBS 121167]|uniref:Uncharacterized protein n=1 Tax=Aplosporella prunicola CBS 121167 TaxID=1176127 RepID=A0A6A6BIH0_9PEZI|nr:uncharacterized protein K452DRAFT_285991 [Aplosporella prunicola CBS 121167]KAF2143115.1 hypothetical protein K452DRAFT_285991 [Aplosporella prunicola CBS 121167]
MTQARGEGRLLRGSRERMRVSVYIETGLFASRESKQGSLRQEGFSPALNIDAV